MKFIKHGFLNVILYGCGLIVVNGASFIMLPFYTRHFAPSEYAFITLLLSFLPLTRYCLAFEICQAAPLFSSDDPQNAVRYISTGFWFTLLSNILFYLLGFTINTYFHFIPLSSFHFIALCTFLLVDALFYFSANVVRWQLKHVIYNVITSGTAILEVILILCFVLIFKFSLYGVFYAWLISRLLGFFAVYFSSKNCYALRFSIKDLKNMLYFSVPLVLSNLPYNLSRNADRLILTAYMGLATVGIYGAGAVIGGVISFVMTSISSSLTPTIYRNHQRKESPIEIIKLFYIILTLCMLIAMSFSLFNKEILKILVSNVYYVELSSTFLVPLFVLTALFSGLYTFFPGLSIKRKTMHVVWINVISLIINLILSISLVIKFGMIGVAFSTCISVFINAICYIALSQKYYPLPFYLNHLALLISFILVGYTMAIYLGLNSVVFNVMNITIRLCYMLVMGIVGGILLWKIFKELSDKSDLETLIVKNPSFQIS
jgi:O-antigen/teichoic acid export membrane protein